MNASSLERACLALLLCAASWTAQAAIKLDDMVPVGPQVKVGKLANGLTYYIQNNGKPENKLELRLIVKAGSILEDEDQRGLAHFTEHMAFNGSTHFKKHELVSYLQSIGVKFGADLNAYTSFDETVYILPIPTTNKANVATGFQVLEDWAHGLTMKDADIDKERGIILEEMRLGKGAQERMSKVLLPKQLNGSKYAERLPIGKEDVLKHFQYGAIKRFYRDWYRPDLMAVVAVGDIAPQDAEKLIAAHFGGLKNPAHERVRVHPGVPTRATSEALAITDAEATNNLVMIQYPVSQIDERQTFREYRRQLVEALFAGMLNARMQELAQQANPPFVGGGSGVNKLPVTGYKSFSSVAIVGQGGAAPAIDALVQENERARQFGFGANELERAKKDMMRNLENAYNERDKTDSSSYVAEYTRNFLEQEAIPGVANEFAYMHELLPGIGIEEMNQFAKSAIPDRAAKLVAYMGSSKDAATPTSAQLLAAVGAAERTTVSAHTEKAVAASLMERPPQPGGIVAETRDTALGLTYLTLSNGVKVILKPTDFQNDQVLMSGQRFGGQLLFDDKDSFNARYANSVVATMGLKDWTPLELQKVLAGKAATVHAGMGNYTDHVSGSAGGSDVETMLQLTYLQFAPARKDDDLYKSFIGKQQELARNAMARPESEFRDTLLSTLYNKNPRVGLTPRPEDFGQVSIERALGIYQERFGSAKDFTFILVGSFDVAAIKPLLATYLASLPTASVGTSYKDIGIRPATGVIKKEVRRGAEAKSTISINFTGATDYSEDEQLRLSALMEVMNIRINEVLREKLALIYGGSANGNLSKIPYGNYAIGLSLPCGPENVDKVIAATFAEIAKLKDQGPQAEDLAKVKQNWLTNYPKALRENGYWLGRLQSSLQNGTDPASILGYEKQVAAITPGELQTMAKRYFNTDNYVQVVLNPEKQYMRKHRWSN